MPYPCNNCDDFPNDPSFPCDVTDILTGDAVDESVINTPLNQLESRTDYLKCLIESLDFTTGHFIDGVTIHEDVEVGHAVYYDASEAIPVYKRAFVDIEGRNIYDTDDGNRTLDSSVQDSSYITGVVVRTSPEVTICVGGTFRTSQFEGALLNNLTGLASVTQPEIFGQYYLTNSTSDNDKGTVQKAKPPLGVPTCFVSRDEKGAVATDYLVSVNPQLHDLLLAHRHYMFKMQAQPATVFPIGYNPSGANTELSGTLAEGELVDVYLYDWSDVCAQTVDTTYQKIGTAIFSGDYSTYGATVVDFNPTVAYVDMIIEEETCIGTGDPVDAFEAFLALWDRGGFMMSEGATPDPSAPLGDIHGGFLVSLEASQSSPVYRDSTFPTRYNISEDLLLIDVVDDNLMSSGWRSCENNPLCPDGASYYYDVLNDNVI